ncbi:MBL fold metallo-hydrolase [Microbacterium amylolyticum]|uniref:L-ascorbate metabolism protein UlaG (Beta-lactamase superfamily) n=1 Tax=Microbacterium amylolyticum TaxID=936337 RepID=A0ABS4ZF07_9MICO|nr:MBL fold metallo-hydrolase [Microbacterium amylolyticum]MBP2435859.1 L-ascorbate metabolism protein UlaG (beta-lactamase superfamily) [Microbacterium amylolyticum]
MRITKNEHAYLTVEHTDETLVIDPGAFCAELGALADVTAIVITHEHPDHWTPEHLLTLRQQFPDAPIFTTAATAAAAPVETTVVHAGDDRQIGAFSLRFFGGTHNEIHASIPRVDNVGVLVNETLYYPGDSYAVPSGVEVPVLAAPNGAPWLKIGEAMDFVLAVRPREAFGTHDKPLSEVGLGMHRQRLAWATEQHGGIFHDLDVGDALTVASP